MVLPASSWGARAPLGLGLWGGPLLLWMGYCGEEKRSLRFESIAKFGVQSSLRSCRGPSSVSRLGSSSLVSVRGPWKDGRKVNFRGRVPPSPFLKVEMGCGFTSCLAKLHIVLQITGQVSSAPAHATSPGLVLLPGGQCTSVTQGSPNALVSPSSLPSPQSVLPRVSQIPQLLFSLP